MGCVFTRGGEDEARRLFDGAYTAGEIFLTSTTLQLKAKAKRPLYLGNAATSGTIENVGARARLQVAQKKSVEMNNALDRLTDIASKFKPENRSDELGRKEYYKQVNKNFGSNYVFDLGLPYGRIAKFIPDKSIQLKLLTLMRKMREQYKSHHPFTFEEVKNLSENVNNPPLIMRRDNSTEGAKAYFEAPGGRIFCVSITPRGLINDIETLYPRDFDKLVETIARSRGKSRDILDVDTSRAVDMLSRRSNTTLSKSIRNSLDDAISVLKNFESVNGKTVKDGDKAGWNYVKKGNETIINFYSDRKTENGGQQPRPVSKTASSEILPQTGVGAQEDAAYLDAVKRGDMETAQRMVIEAAARASRRN